MIRRKDIHRMMPVFSGYMGHVMPRSTEEYLHLVPGRFRKPLAKLASTKTLSESPQTVENVSKEVDTVKNVSS